MSTLYEEMKEGLREAAAVARGEKKPAATFIPPDIDVRAIRKGLNLSQTAFAATFGFTLAQVRGWEQGRFRPLGAMRAYMLVIRQDPSRVAEVLKDAAA